MLSVGTILKKEREKKGLLLIDIENQIKVLSEIKYKFEENVEIKKLGDVCEFKNGKNITMEQLVPGNYPVIGGGLNPMGYHDQYNVDELTTIISKIGAYAGYVSRYNTKSFITNNGIFIFKYNNILKNEKMTVA